MKTYLYSLLGLLLFTGCQTHPPDFAAFIKSTSKSLARKDCISEARLVDFAKHPDSVDRPNIERWVHQKQDEQNIADPVLVGFDKMAVESDVTVKDEDSLNLKADTSLTSILTLGLAHTGQNDNKLNIAALHVATLSDMPSALFDDRISSLESNKMDLLKLLAGKETPANTVSLLTDEFHAKTTELDELKGAKQYLQRWIMGEIKEGEQRLAMAKMEAKPK